MRNCGGNANKNSENKTIRNKLGMTKAEITERIAQGEDSRTQFHSKVLSENLFRNMCDYDTLKATSTEI